MGPLDRLFDRNGDGSLDPFERAQQMDFFDYMSKDGLYKEGDDVDDMDFDGDHDDFDDFGSDDFGGDDFD